jgi:hypothetical protein
MSDQPTPEETRELLNRTAAEERYGDGFADGFATGKAEGLHDGYGQGYREGFDAGAEVGAERMLRSLKGALGEELIDALMSDSEAKLPHTETYRERTAYTAPADRPEWRGTDNGEQLPRWSSTSESEVEERVARIDQRRQRGRESGNGRGMEASA